MENVETIGSVARREGDRNDKTRRHNLSIVLSLLHHSGASSRSELTRRTGLNRSTVSALVAELAKNDLVYETMSSAQSGVGRPSPVVHPNSNVAVLAVNPDLDAIGVGLVGLGGVVHHRIRHELKSRPSPAQAVHHIARIMRKMRPVLEPYSIVAVGAAVPGLIRRSDGVVQLAPHLKWRNEPFADRLQAATGYPTFVGNDARLGMIAETVFGAAKGVQDLVYLNGSTSGIGAGVLVGGRPLIGADGYGGELGHTLIRPGGRQCYCGKRGCLETEVKLSYLLSLLGKEALSEEELDDALSATRDRRINTEARRQVDLLTEALASFTSAFNPEAIVLGGFLGSLHGMMSDRIYERMVELSSSVAVQRVRLERAQLGPQLPVVGAAELAFGGLLNDPLGTVSR